MSPEEAKGWVDIVTALLGVGGLGGIALALMGAKKAKSEQPEKEPEQKPTIGAGGMQAIGAGLIAEAQVDALTKALAALTLAHVSLSEQRRNEAQSQMRMAEALLDLGRKFIDELHDLRRSLKDLRPGD